MPEAAVNRLPLYCRLLSKLGSEGQSIVSSHELAAALDLGPSLVRKDLGYVGRHGRQGNGLTVERLERELRAILGLERRWHMVLVGTGRLGQAIAAYPGFAAEGFDLAGLYDAYPALIGLTISGMEVRDVRLLERDSPSDRQRSGSSRCPRPRLREWRTCWYGLASGASSTTHRSRCKCPPTSNCSRSIRCCSCSA